MTTTTYQQLRRNGKLCGTIKAANAKRAARDQALPVDPPADVLSRTHTVPVGSSLAREITTDLQERNPRKQNWTGDVHPSRCNLTRFGTLLINDCGRYSSRCSYRHYTYSGQVRCCAQISRRQIVALIGTQRIRIRLGKAWQFGSDNLGLYVVRVKSASNIASRYHFDSDDLGRGFSGLRTAAMDHEAALRDGRRNLRDRDRSLRIAGLWVGYHDSRSAGNCHAGTVKWCRQHGLSINRRYPIKDIENLEQSERLRRVIAAAERRTLQEMKQGFCKIESLNQ